jgi:hypothetical protein
MGTPCDLRKAVVLGQARIMENLCMKIVSYPLFTHKEEQMTTNMKKQENVDLQSKSIVGIPQTAFPKKHGLHTQSTNQVKARKNMAPLHFQSVFSLCHSLHSPCNTLGI